MPHSSGGGSHGGGSHSSHSSHYSSSGGSSRRTSHSSFSGSKRYVYFAKGKPVFVYSNYDITQTQSQRGGKIGTVLVSVLMIGVLFAMMPSFVIPKKLDVTSYTSSIVISDTIDVIDDEDAVMDSLKRFQDKTGITPAVITVNNEYWQGNYSSLENYAYDLYVNAFKDEKHWLIVYSEPEAGTSGDFVDWYWEGMQGDDTDRILNDRNNNLFRETFHKCLIDNSISVDDALITSFDTLTPVSMKMYFPLPILLFDILYVGILVLGTLKTVFSNTSKHYSQAVECPETFVDQEACEYCGGIYIVGLNTSCPHCGAPVKPHDYTVDGNGNITNIIN